MLLAGGGPVGSVTSSESFLLSGHSVPVADIPNWPVMVGDDITTTSSSAVLQFQDGSRVLLFANSSGKIEQGNNSLVFRLQTGSATINSSPDSRVAFFAKNAPVVAKAGVETPMSSRSPAATATLAKQATFTPAVFRLHPISPR